MDQDEVEKRKELGQYLAILTSGLVNNAYLLKKLLWEIQICNFEFAYSVEVIFSQG